MSGKRLRDLGDTTWRDFMRGQEIPTLTEGDVYVFRSKGDDYDGFTVAMYQRYNQMGACDMCRKAIFWDHEHALAFAQTLMEKGK